MLAREALEAIRRSRGGDHEEKNVEAPAGR